MDSAVDQVWAKFAEMFGVSALTNKFGAKPPQTWRTALASLNEFQLARGMNRALHFTKGVPNLPEFLRMCREVASDDLDPEGPRIAPSHQIQGPLAQRWEAEAGIHLLSYVTDQSKHRIFYASEELTAPLVKAKKEWAQDMRDAEMAAALPADNGKQWWGE